jgi:hypothetical protein
LVGGQQHIEKNDMDRANAPFAWFSHTGVCVKNFLKFHPPDVAFVCPHPASLGAAASFRRLTAAAPAYSSSSRGSSSSSSPTN